MNYDLSDNETGVQTSKIEDSSDDTEGTFVDLVRTTAEQKKCIVCNRKRSSKTNNKFKRLSDKTIVDAYIKTSILIPFGCRICPHHLDVYGFLKKQCLGKPLQAIYFYLRRL